MSWRPSNRADAEDRAWFAQHPHAIARVRALAEGEDAPSGIAGATLFLVVVRRIVAPMWGTPPTSEVVLHEVFGTGEDEIREAHPGRRAYLLIQLLAARQGDHVSFPNSAGRWTSTWHRGRGEGAS
jgi:hypothetical protein